MLNYMVGKLDKDIHCRRDCQLLNLHFYKMETVKEFFETSTIHGFAYLASTKSYLGKALWAVVILTAFFFAGFFIQRSYNSWEKSPVDTTLSVHSIEELRFPAITVCPPENTNTAQQGQGCQENL